LFLDKNGSKVSPGQLSSALSDVCVPLAGRRIRKLLVGEGLFDSSDELMIEYELCIGLIFKPLRHHLTCLLATETGNHVLSIWKAVLTALELLLADDGKSGESVAAGQNRSSLPIPQGLKVTMKNLANEHLRNAIMVLMSSGVVLAEPAPSNDEITIATIQSVARMGISESLLREWKQSALEPSHA